MPNNSAESFNYFYLSRLYHQTLLREISGGNSFSTADLVDAFSVPVALEIARRAGVAVPSSSLDPTAFNPPALVWPVNPFTEGFGVIRDVETAPEILKHFSRKDHFGVFVEDLREDDEVVTFKFIEGLCFKENFADFAERIFGIFRVPAFEAVVILRDEEILLAGLMPIFKLSLAERKIYENFKKERG